MYEGNKLIAFNSLILYSRLIISSVFGLLSTRLILKNLGLEDFGIYMIVGGVVSIIGLVNTVMTSSSTRFITYELAKGSERSVNKIFNLSFHTHAFIAICVLLIGLPLGEWYINNHLVIPVGKLLETLWVFRLAVLGSIVSFLGVPFIGLLMAKEKFLPYSIVEIIISLAKFIVAFFIGYSDNQKLVTYALFIAFLTALPTFVYWKYSRVFYLNLVKYEFINKHDKYKEFFKFSTWIGFGAIATMGKTQGANLLVNNFFGVALNAALGISYAVNAIITTFSATVNNAISPQITKSYANGNIIRTEDLVISSSKYTFFLLLLPSVPLFIDIDFFLNLWLDIVPLHTASFIRLMLIDGLIGGLNAGIPQAIFATGNIKWYQLIINSVFLLSLPVAFIVLKITTIPEALLVSYVGISIIAFLLRQILLKKIVGFNVKRILIESYLPSFWVGVSLVPLVIYSSYLSSPLLRILASIFYVIFSIYFLGLNKKEKIYLFKIIKNVKLLSLK